MSAGALPPEQVPTLTEVVAWPESTPAVASVSSQNRSFDEARAFEDESPEVATYESDMPTYPDQLEERIVQRVLEDLQRQLDLMLEYRMREMLTPLLNRMADNLVREVRSELASTLREVVARAVAQEIARHRTP